MNTLARFRFTIIQFVAFLLIGFNPNVLSAEAQAESAQQLIKRTADEVISYVKQHRAELEKDPQKLYKLVNEKIVPHVDLMRVSRWVLGKHWRKATTEQKKKFAEEFKKLLIRTYATGLLKFTDEKIVYPPVKGGIKNGKVTVRSDIILPDGQKFSIQYRMHHKDKVWKIYDIAVDGVSLVSTYRTSFSTEIKKTGLKGLLASLEEKNRGFTI